MDVSGRRTEAEQSSAVMSAKVVPSNYLHFKKDDGGTTEKSTDNDKRIGLVFKDSNPFNLSMK